MPPEILYGTDIPALLARARTRLGEDARVVSLRRAPVGGFELLAEPAGPSGPVCAPMRPEGLDPSRRGAGPARVIALVGPTGSGKTLAYVLPVLHRLYAALPAVDKAGGGGGRGGGSGGAQCPPAALVLVPLAWLAYAALKSRGGRTAAA